MKPWISHLLKFGVSGGILAYLLCDAWGQPAFRDLAEQPKEWPLLAAAWGICLLGVFVTILRWHLLVRALDLPVSFGDSLRLGSLGYLLNFVSLGSVGGDLFKAIFIAREQPRRRAEAVATVVLDRVIGLYALFLLASLAVIVGGQLHATQRETQVIAQGTLVATLVGTLLVVALLVPGTTGGRLSEAVCRWPRVGPVLHKLIHAVRVYRRKGWVLTLSLMMSLGSHALFALCVYLIAQGLPGVSPDLPDHMVIVPVAMVTGVLPLPLSGLGAFEGVLDFLYRTVPTTFEVAKGQGLLVALGYRGVTIAIALVAAIGYLWQRRTIDPVLKLAEKESLVASAPL